MDPLPPTMSSSTAAKYSSGATLRRSLGTPCAAHARLAERGMLRLRIQRRFADSGVRSTPQVSPHSDTATTSPHIPKRDRRRA